jgi:riboflavin kinase / FMN adenylyltransferase
MSAGSVLAAGAFDGVHRGHRVVLEETVRVAQRRRCRSTCVVFAGAAPMLGSLDRRVELIRSCGIDDVRVDDEVPMAEIVDAMQPVAVVSGAAIDVEGRETVRVPMVMDDTGGAPISSAMIRNALAASDITTANGLLGREYDVQGVVQHGDQRGREIGFPTANVTVPEQIQLPGDGVYAGWYERPNGVVHRCAISVGRRPTFYEDNALLLVEAYLLDFDGDLYDELARVRFETWLRGQTRFASVDDLVAQMTKDVARTRELTST